MIETVYGILLLLWLVPFVLNIHFDYKRGDLRIDETVSWHIFFVILLYLAINLLPVLNIYMIYVKYTEPEDFWEGDELW